MQPDSLHLLLLLLLRSHWIIHSVLFCCCSHWCVSISLAGILENEKVVKFAKLNYGTACSTQHLPIWIRKAFSSTLVDFIHFNIICTSKAKYISVYAQHSTFWEPTLFIWCERIVYTGKVIAIAIHAFVIVERCLYFSLLEKKQIRRKEIATHAKKYILLRYILCIFHISTLSTHRIKSWIRFSNFSNDTEKISILNGICAFHRMATSMFVKQFGKKTIYLKFINSIIRVHKRSSRGLNNGKLKCYRSIQLIWTNGTWINSLTFSTRTKLVLQ